MLGIFFSKILYACRTSVFQFLVACTSKCELGSYARVLYDWEGKPVAKLEDGKHVQTV